MISANQTVAHGGHVLFFSTVKRFNKDRLFKRLCTQALGCCALQVFNAGRVAAYVRSPLLRSEGNKQFSFIFKQIIGGGGGDESNKSIGALAFMSLSPSSVELHPTESALHYSFYIAQIKYWRP